MLLNMLAKPEQICRVLDFGGGTGFVYFNLLRHFTHPAAIQWIVVDNPTLRQIGERYRGPQDQIEYFDTLPRNRVVDVVFINTSLQFVPDHRSLLAALIELQATHIVLTRLVAGDFPNFYTEQRHIHGLSAACAFLNLRELRMLLAEHGYEMVHYSRGGEDQWAPELYLNVPLERQLRSTANLIFRLSNTQE